MTNAIQKKWLWLLVGIWLVVLQSVAQIHYEKHSLQPHSHCLLCDFSSIQSAGSSTFPDCLVNLQRPENVAEPCYHKPSLPWLRELTVRAPPFLLKANLIT